MARKKMEPDDWATLRFEVGNLFTPSTPITTAELFAGRQPQITKLLDVVGERGRHAIIYGEPGVGKTSIAQILRLLVPVKTSFVRYIRKQVFSSDTFSTIWMDIFREVRFIADIGEGQREYTISDLYTSGITPADVVRELSTFPKTTSPS